MTEALGLIEVIGYPPAIEAADAALKAANVKLGAVTRVDGGIVTVQILGDVGAVKAAVDAGGSSAARVGTVRATHVIPRLDSSLTSFLTEPGKGMRNLGSKAGTKIVPKVESITSTAILQTNGPIKSENHTEQPPVVNIEIGNTGGKIEISQKDVYVTEGEDEISDALLEVVAGADTVSDTGSIEENQISNKPPISGTNERLTPPQLKKLSSKELKNLIASLGIKVAAKKLKTIKKEELIHMITQFYKEGEN